jgi:hypothetical protein
MLTSKALLKIVLGSCITYFLKVCPYLIFKTLREQAYCRRKGKREGGREGGRDRKKKGRGREGGKEENCKYFLKIFMPRFYM